MTIGLVVLQVALKLLKVLCNFYIFERNLRKTCQNTFKRRKIMFDNNPEILEDGTKYYPPIDSCSYDEHELDMYFIGDNYGKDED